MANKRTVSFVVLTKEGGKVAFYVKFRAYLAVVIYFLLLVLAAGPHFYLILAYSSFGKNSSLKRKRLSFWQMFWVRPLCALTNLALGVRTRYIIHPDLRGKKNRGPFVVVSNHRSTLDGLVIPVMLSKLGARDFKSVMKREVSTMPVLGKCWKLLGCAFVMRQGDPQDVETIAKTAQLAKEDRASIVIFPEGTRLKGTPKGEYKNLLPTKTRGLKKILEELPEYQILTITLAYSGTNDLCNSPLELSDFVGSRVEVIAELAPAGVDSKNFPVWLDLDWKNKEKILSILVR